MHSNAFLFPTDSVTSLQTIAEHFLITVGIFALFGLAEDWSRSQNTARRKIIVGIVFGCLASLMIAMAVRYSSEVVLDARNAILAICAFFVGPIPAAIAALITSATRAYFGGLGVPTAIMGMWISVGCGLAYRAWLDQNNQRIGVLNILLFSVISPVITLSVFFLMPFSVKEIVASGIIQALYMTTAFWTFVFGLIMLQDLRRHELVDDLAASEKRAEEATKAKSLFLAKMSHEIRTPINGVFGFSELLRKTKLDETQDYYLKQIHSAVSSMILLVDDILDFSKIEAGKMKIVKHTFNIRSLMESCIDLVQPDADRKNLELHMVIGPNVPEYIVNDELRLRQVVMNLLSNALKFTQSGSVRLSLHSSPIDEQNETLTISVTDTGIGIAEDKLKIIFEAFEQADTSITRNFGGTGLGLSIALNLMTQMDGKITVNSEHGRGTTFTVTLPTLVADGIIPASNTLDAEQAMTQQTEKAHILIAEDIPMNQALVSAQLRKGGYSFDIVDNGYAAVEAVKSKQYDMVLMDIQMPGMSGIEATTVIREELGLSAIDLPIVALTAHALPDEMKACLEAGMDECLVKPVDALKLYKTIDSVLGLGADDPFVTPPVIANDLLPVPLLNTEQVEQFSSYIGDDQLLKLFHDFIMDAERILTTLEESGSIPRGDLHSMTGVAGNFGLSRLAQYCRQLLDEQSDLARSGITPPIDVIHRLLTLFNDSIGAFQAYMTRPHAAGY